MPVRDLRPGRASIAARGASQRASQPARADRLTSPRVGVLRDIIDSVFCSLLLPHDSPTSENVRMPRDVTRHTPRMESDLFDAGFYRVPRRADEIHYCVFGVSDFYAR